MIDFSFYYLQIFDTITLFFFLFETSRETLFNPYKYGLSLTLAKLCWMQTCPKDEFYHPLMPFKLLLKRSKIFTICLTFTLVFDLKKGEVYWNKYKLNTYDEVSCAILCLKEKTPFYFLLLEGKFYVNMHGNAKRRVFYFKQHKKRVGIEFKLCKLICLNVINI